MESYYPPGLVRVEPPEMSLSALIKSREYKQGDGRHGATRRAETHRGTLFLFIQIIFFVLLSPLIIERRVGQFTIQTNKTDWSPGRFGCVAAELPSED